MNDRPLSSHPNNALRGWRMPEGVPSSTLWYRCCRRTLQLALATVCSTRVYNRHFEPTSGPVVYICNHQSFFDPPLMGMALRRPMNFMARDTLFRMPGFGRLISSVNAFPVRRGTGDMAAMKEGMRRVKGGGQLVVFAEGTRTQDGRIGPFLPGVALMAQRTRAVTVPVLIDGAYECWPRTQRLPSPGRIIVQYGRPIPPEESRAMKAAPFVNRVRDELIAIQADVRRRAGLPALVYGDDE